MTPTEHGAVLLALARAAIGHALGVQGDAADPSDSVASATTAQWLRAPGACFVTLTQGGALRGCIGSLEARRPLAEDVRANAVAAALRDPRFAALGQAELGATEIEVSLLSPQQALSFDGEADALSQLRPAVDGVVFECGTHRSTFLPQVWGQLPTPSVFMAHLKQKAGLPAHFWSKEVRLSRYTVEHWKESEQRVAPPARGTGTGTGSP